MISRYYFGTDKEMALHFAKCYNGEFFYDYEHNRYYVKVVE